MNTATTATTNTATHEQLYRLAREGNEQALYTLCRDYRPLFLSESRMYQNRMETMDAEDFVQEGFITVWKIVTAGNYDTNSGSFGGYLKKAIKYRFSRIWTDFCLKNPVCLGETEDCRGNITRFYGIAECAERTRKQGRERARRWREKKAAETDAERAEQGLPPVYRPSKATESERAAHEEEMKRRRMERTRAYQKKRRDADRANYNELRRIEGGISRNRKAVEKWTAKGNTERAEKARIKLKEYEREMERFKKGA